MNTDLRGFRYQLQPMLNRQSWRVDALQSRVGVAVRAVVEAKRAIERRERQLAERHRALRDAGARGLHPALHFPAVQWLASERTAIAWAHEELGRLEKVRAELSRECRAQEARLLGMREHRRNCRADHATVEQRRIATTADSDWLVRHARTGSARP